MTALVPILEPSFPSLDDVARLLWDRPDGRDVEKALVLRQFSRIWACVAGVPTARAMAAAERIIDEQTRTADERHAEAQR